MLTRARLGGKVGALKARATDRLLAFRPGIRDIVAGGVRVRFLIATPQAADWYDPPRPANLRELAWLAANVAPGARSIVDAGAFHGLYGAVLGKAAGAGARVVAVDPVAANCAVTEANLALNGIDARVVCAAVSNADGPVRFSRDSCGRVLPSGGVEVASVQLAAVAGDADLVKLDIEGEEFTVVPAQIDACARADRWIVEIHPGRGDVAGVTGAFAERGFDLWWSPDADGAFRPYDGSAWQDRGTLVALRGAPAAGPA